MPSNEIIRKEAEQVDVETFWVTWEPTEGVPTDITRLDESHVRNLYKWMKERKYKWALVIISMEVDRRNGIPLTPDYELACYQYQQKPEADRLVVHGEPRYSPNRSLLKGPLL